MRDFHRVLVTGAAGFIGSNYVRYALSRHPSWQVVVLDRLTYAGSIENLRDVRDQVDFVRGDIADPADVAVAMAGADAVVNFAAETHVDRSLMDAGPFLRTNVTGTLVLLQAARRCGVARFLQVSSDEVYGDLSGTARRAAETDALRPRSPYAATKAAAEHLVFSYGTSYGLDVVATRGANTYGPYQYPEKIIPLFTTNALQGRPLPLYGDGSAVRDYLHADDHCSGIDLVLHRGACGEAYNIGAGLGVSALDLALRIIDVLGGSRDLLRFVADRPGHDYRYAVDPARLQALGWRRRWSFADGLAQTVAWYRDHREWWRAIKERQAFRDYERSLYGGALPTPEQGHAD